VAAWEPFTAVVLALVALIMWASWYGDVFRINHFAAPKSSRLVLGLTPVACLTFLLLCLEKMAATAVRESTPYVLIYLALGAAALGVSAQFYQFLGISARDDVLERRNVAALIAIVAALVGTTLCVAGGNVGEGPGMKAVIVSAGTALGTWFVLWYVEDLLSGRVVAERITVERDMGSGVRLAGLLIANGVILGAASAGNWIAARFTCDFALSAWPALALTVLAALIERVFGWRHFIGRSILTASGYLLLAIAWVLHRGLEA